MCSFHEKQNKWRQCLCIICHEAWPSRICLGVDPAAYICTRCKRDKSDVKKFSEENDMLPGNVPLCLQRLSQVEEMLIAHACPIMCVYRKSGGQRGYKGHVLNLPQDVQGFLDLLPCNVCDLPVLLLRRVGQDNTHADLRVHREKVLSALQWLQANNCFYSSITIDWVALHRPEDDIPDELCHADDDGKEEQVEFSDADMDLIATTLFSLYPREL